MNLSPWSEILGETNPVKEHRGNPGVDTGPQEPCSIEQTPPRNPVGPSIPDGIAFETFVGGAVI